MNLKKITALGLSATMAASMLLTGCGGSASSDEEMNSFTYFLSDSCETYFAEEYEDAPAVKYWLSKEWDVDGTPTKVSIDFITPTSGGGRDQISTLIATGEYPDVINMAYVANTVNELYDEGVIIDLTDYVEKYMPNYMAYMEEHPTYKKQMYNEGKILQLYAVANGSEDPWGGFCYRRDWLVKYGTNPETGEAFTGGWVDEEKTVWEDDVVFPSGGTDPVTISDWEFMFEAFKKAVETEAIDGGYAMQNYYLGYHPTGDINAGFNGSCNFYLDQEGVVQDGYVEDGTRAFIECMNYWYEQGWMDPQFEERSNDVVWTYIDTAGVYSGKVGLWYGLESQLGNDLETADYPETDGICVYGAAQPINDKYGDASVQNVEPWAFFMNSWVSSPVVITNKAEEKNLPALLTALDYLYTTEGSMLHTYGLSDTQQAEVQDELYKEYGLDGTYTIGTDEEGNTCYYLVNVTDIESGLNDAVAANFVVGLYNRQNYVKDYSELVQRAKKQWTIYDGTGCLMNTSITSKIGTEYSDRVSQITTPINQYVSTAIPDFVTGRTELNDGTWQEFCDTIEGYGAAEYVDILNEAANN